MARDVEDVKYRGRRRWNGNHGRVWWDGKLLFEISKFECKVTADRDGCGLYFFCRSIKNA